MSKDSVYTGGVIAVKENGLLKEKLYKLCETDAEEALRAVTESGFGRGAEVSSPSDYEALIAAEERDLEAFVREYAPNKAILAYVLSPRDFHNVKALLKAKALGRGAEEMLAPEGEYPLSVLVKCADEGDFSPLSKELAAAAAEVYSAFHSEEDGKELSGAEIGAIFEKAQFAYLKNACGKNVTLKKLVAAKADMLNILTALRSDTPEYAANNYVSGGKLKEKQLEKLFDSDTEKVARAFDNTPYKQFTDLCLSAREKGLPLTEAERIYEGYETQYLSERKYELKASQPFLYYVFRRRAEIANVRILFVCLLAGMDEGDIRRRMRTV